MSRVLHVISGLGMGGAERNLVQVATGLAASGMEQRVVCLARDGVWSGSLRLQHIPLDTLGVSSSLGMAAAVYKLSKIIRNWNPTVLQGWMGHGNLAAALAHKMTLGTKSRKLYWNLRASNLREAHHLLIVRLTAAVSRWPDLIISNSVAGLDFHISMKFKPRNAIVIENGIDTDKFKPDPHARNTVRDKLNISGSRCVAIHAARVDPMKDHQSFMDAMCRLPKVQGILVGAGTEKLHAPGNVIALGMQNEIEQLYPAADQIVSSSAYAEGFSNVIAEGMSAGLIPIATDVGDARRIVGDTGFIVPPGQPKALAVAMSAAAELSEMERNARARQARGRISQLFSLNAKLKAYAGLYA